MLCDQCHINEANVRLRLSRNNEIVDLNLCSACAGKMQLGSGLVPSLFDTSFSSSWPSYDLLSSALFGVDLGKGADLLEQIKACPACGQSYENFRQTGLLGCASCYEVFRPALEQILKRVQRGTRHMGHRPGTKEQLAAGANPASPNESVIDNLRRQLEQAVGKEDYLKAIELRDEIKKMEKE